MPLEGLRYYGLLPEDHAFGKFSYDPSGLKGCMVRTGQAVRWGSVRFWALAVSLALHAVALAVFTGVKISGRMETRTAERPALTMQAIQRVSTQPKPVPRVESVAPVLPPVQPAPADKPVLVSDSSVQVSKVDSEPTSVSPAETIPQDVEQETGTAADLNEVEFFGQKTAVEQICFVVDCSGSMYGQMYRVKEQLKQSILRLNSGQAFCVVFFMDGQRILMSGDKRLEPATSLSKSRALELIAAIKPAGATDAAHALKTALQLKGPDGGGPEVVYFLTDGFDLDESDARSFSENAQSLWRTLAPEAVIHTIGFGPEAQDRMRLSALARNTGGNYIEVD